VSAPVAVGGPGVGRSSVVLEVCGVRVFFTACTGAAALGALVFVAGCGTAPDKSDDKKTSDAAEVKLVPLEPAKFEDELKAHRGKVVVLDVWSIY
jgi:hypothetical protein